MQSAFAQNFYIIIIYMYLRNLLEVFYTASQQFSRDE